MRIILKNIVFRAGYLPGHRDDPIFPTSGEELAAVVDEMNFCHNETCDYMTIFVIDSSGSHLALIGVGVRAGDFKGSMHYIGAEGEFYSKGLWISDEPVVYYDFGNERFFAPSSQIALDDLKNALVQLYNSGGARPDNVEWQEWQDRLEAELLGDTR